MEVNQAYRDLTHTHTHIRSQLKSRQSGEVAVSYSRTVPSHVFDVPSQASADNLIESRAGPLLLEMVPWINI